MKELPVIFSQETQAASGSATRGFDSLGGGRLNSSNSNGGLRNLPTEKLAASLSSIKDSLDDIFASIKQVGNFELNEVQLTLEITAEGGFALVGLAKAGATGGITLTFAPPK